MERFMRSAKRVAVTSSLSLLAAFAISPVLAANTIEILSSRPDKVSGGDALVQINVDKATAVVVTVNGVDVSGSFFATGERGLLGYVTGLANGKNRLEVFTPRPRGKSVRLDTLTITNHPIHGPVFSGPQEQPYYCQTHQFRIYPDGPFLTNAQIVDPCTVLTRVDYVYRTTIDTFAAFDPAAPWPADLAMTTTNEGHTVPYIVRLETGTINRAIYQTAILDDPRTMGPDIRNHTDAGWNGRLVYTFGGGCSSGQYRQGSTTGGVLEDTMLSKGFAVASASLNVLGNNCNHVISAETVMMVKERFIEAYGLPRYTIGWGCSGGAVQQYMVTDSYPGLLDGIVPQCSFPDLFQAVVARLPATPQLLLERRRRPVDARRDSPRIGIRNVRAAPGPGPEQRATHGSRSQPTRLAQCRVERHHSGRRSLRSGPQSDRDSADVLRPPREHLRSRPSKASPGAHSITSASNTALARSMRARSLRISSLISMKGSAVSTSTSTSFRSVPWPIDGRREPHTRPGAF